MSVYSNWNFFLGLADPNALQQAVSAFNACQYIGMPECEVMSSYYCVSCAMNGYSDHHSVAIRQ